MTVPGLWQIQRQPDGGWLSLRPSVLRRPQVGGGARRIGSLHAAIIAVAAMMSMWLGSLSGEHCAG